MGFHHWCINTRLSTALVQLFINPKKGQRWTSFKIVDPHFICGRLSLTNCTRWSTAFSWLSIIDQKAHDKQMSKLLILIWNMGVDHWCIYTRWSTALFWLVINHKKKPSLNGWDSCWPSIRSEQPKIFPKCVDHRLFLNSWSTPLIDLFINGITIYRW